jgi:hypothetical protein
MSSGNEDEEAAVLDAETNSLSSRRAATMPCLRRPRCVAMGALLLLAFFADSAGDAQDSCENGCVLTAQAANATLAVDANKTVRLDAELHATWLLSTNGAATSILHLETGLWLTVQRGAAVSHRASAHLALHREPDRSWRFLDGGHLLHGSLALDMYNAAAPTLVWWKHLPKSPNQLWLATPAVAALSPPPPPSAVKPPQPPPPPPPSAMSNYARLQAAIHSLPYPLPTANNLPAAVAKSNASREAAIGGMAAATAPFAHAAPRQGPNASGHARTCAGGLSRRLCEVCLVCGRRSCVSRRASSL